MTTADDVVPFYPMTRESPFDPPQKLAHLQADEPIRRVRIWDGSSPWLVTRYDDARKVLADPRFSSDPHNVGYPSGSAAGKARTQHERPSMVHLDDPEHARLRRAVSGEFTVRRIQQLRPMVERTVRELLDSLANGPNPTDLVSAFTLPLPSRVSCYLLGVPYSDHQFFQETSHTLQDHTASEHDVRNAVDTLQDYLDDLIAFRRQKPADDVAGRLAARVAAGQLEASEAGALAWLLLLAGHENTANMLSLGTLTLLRHYELADVVRTADENVVRGVVEELLRILTVTHFGRRRAATEDVEVSGTLIRAGEGVIVAGEIANRDPRKYDRPDVIDYTQGSNQHLAFGFGVHQCLGQTLARLELQVAYPALLRRFTNIRVIVPDSEILFRHQMTIYGVYALPVEF
jgi:cytochrome P450